MDVIAINLFVVGLLLAANAFFVAAEFALVKAKPFRIENAAKNGSSAARLTVRIQSQVESYLAACQLGITMASLGLGWVGEPVVAAILTPIFVPLGMSDATLHTVAFLMGFFIFSALHIVVGEQVPKTFAIRKAEQMSLAVAYPLRYCYILLFPLTWLLNKASASILKLFNVQEATHGEVLTDQEIRGLIDVSSEHGHMHADKAEMLHNLFKFDERSVARIMIPRIEVDVLRTEASPDANLRVIRETNHSRYPVVSGENDNIVGILLVKDFMDVMIDGATTPWDDLSRFCRTPVVVPETMRMARTFEMMRAARTHIVLIIDEYGSFAGLVTLEDLLEEIVGDIADEMDAVDAEFPIVEVDGGWQAHGLAPWADVERATGISVPDHLESNTISGLMMNELQRIPAVGDRIEIGSFIFVVREIKGRRVESVKIERLSRSGAIEPSADELIKTDPVGEGSGELANRPNANEPRRQSDDEDR